MKAAKVVRIEFRGCGDQLESRDCIPQLLIDGARNGAGIVLRISVENGALLRFQPHNEEDHEGNQRQGNDSRQCNQIGSNRSSWQKSRKPLHVERLRPEALAEHHHHGDHRIYPPQWCFRRPIRYFYPRSLTEPREVHRTGYNVTTYWFKYVTTLTCKTKTPPLW